MLYVFDMVFCLVETVHDALNIPSMPLELMIDIVENLCYNFFVMATVRLFLEYTKEKEQKVECIFQLSALCNMMIQNRL